MFPAAMQPPILGGILTHELLDGFRVFRRHPFQRIVLIRPFFGENNTIRTDFKEKTVVDPSAATYYDRDILGNREQAYALIRAGRATEKIDEYPLPSGILVCDEAQSRTGRGELLHQLSSALFVDDLLPNPPTDAVQVPVEKPIIQRSGNAVDIETKQTKKISDDLKVGIVSGNQ